MKNSILLVFLFIISLAFCTLKDGPKNQSILNKTSSAADSKPECFTSYQVYTETAIMWQESWVSYYDSLREGNYDDSPRVSFDALNLNSMYSEVKDSTHPGILMWYTLLDSNDLIPSLAIQNTVGCKIDSEGTILLASGNDTTHTVNTITQGYLDIIKENWSKSGILTPGVHTKINGYNYEWDSIQQLMNLSTGPQGLYVHYGLRTMEPSESDNFATPKNPNKTGSIIYCNIIYGDNFETNPSATLLDFAMPCPIYCGNNNFENLINK